MSQKEDTYRAGAPKDVPGPPSGSHGQRKAPHAILTQQGSRRPRLVGFVLGRALPEFDVFESELFGVCLLFRASP